MKFTKTQKRMFVHAMYTSLLILASLFIYDIGNFLRNVLLDTNYFKNKPYIKEALIRSVHITAIFATDFLLVFLIYKLFKILY
uniref:Uncharacterized protein n=1 Tax=viral metagenome TaxID=1070528 RepID=A0A6C0F5B0_9ZZZZ